MKILTFSAYYTPEIAASMYLTEDILETFAKSGNQIELFVPTPTRGISDATRKEFAKRRQEYRYDKQMVIHRIPLFREGKKTLVRAFRYVVLELEFLFKGLTTEADLIFVQSTPPIQGALAAILKKIKKVPFIYNLQDIFPDSLVNTGMTKEGTIIWKLGRVIENFTYKNADKIIVISEDFKKNIIAKGVPENKIEIVYNWVDENAVINVSRKDNPLFDRYGLDRDKFYICYSGNIGFTQNMDMLLNVAKQLQDEENLGFVIVGDGAYKAKVEERIQKEQIQNVKLIPFQSYEDISYVFSLGDIGLVISKGGVGSNSVPSKTWSYMSAERPILASFDVDSELCQIVQENNCGVCVPSDNAEALKQAIILMTDKKNNEEGRNGRRFVLEHLTREIGTKAYYDELVRTEKNFYER